MDTEGGKESEEVEVGGLRFSVESDPFDDGSFATVHRGVDLQTGNPVAVKRIRRGGRSAARFRNSVAVHRAVSSDGDPRLLRLVAASAGFDPEFGIAVIVTNLVEGDNAFDAVSTGPALTRFLERVRSGAVTVRTLCLRLARTLLYLHGLGIVHGDVKPENYVLENDDEENGSFRAVLLDYGAAYRVNTPETEPERDSVRGTLYYLPPEVREGKGCSFAGDVYSLGVAFTVFLERTTFEVPFTNPEDRVRFAGPDGGNAVQAMATRMTHPDPVKRPALAEVVETLMEREPEPEPKPKSKSDL